MGIFNRFHGRDASEGKPAPLWLNAGAFATPDTAGSGLTDKQAIARYRLLIRTAPPETIEHAHAAAFAQLTPAQRQMILAELGHEMPSYEWETGLRFGAEPRSLARMATRAELERPGTLERVFGRIDLAEHAAGLGESSSGAFLGRFAGLAVASWAATQFFMESDLIQGQPDDLGAPTVGHDVVIDERPLNDPEDWGI